jgi:hypothetical protein
MTIWSLGGVALFISRLSLSVISVFLGFMSCPIMDMMSCPPCGLHINTRIKKGRANQSIYLNIHELPHHGHDVLPSLRPAHQHRNKKKDKLINQSTQ